MATRVHDFLLVAALGMSVLDLSFGIAALAGFLVGETAAFFEGQQNTPWLGAVAAAALLLAFVAVGALLWSTAWVYGDETADR